MNIKRIAAEASLYLTGIALSCGVSQVYGLIKGTLDLKKYFALSSKIKEWQRVESLCGAKRFDELKNTGAFKRLQSQLPAESEEILYKHILAKTKDRLFDLRERREIRKTSLKKDLVSLIPVVGALFAWRIGAGKCAKEFSMLPFFEHAFAHATDLRKGQIQKMFYLKSGSKAMTGTENHVKIPVDSRGGYLDAIFCQGACALPTGPTVVIFHGNACTCDNMVDIGEWYAWQGYNILIPTMGGYPGSPGVSTSEGSSYQDVEAVKIYLESRGIKQAGYHGLSMGGTLAFQAATGKSESKVETLFVVADQTLSHAEGVVERMVCSCLGSIARGVARMAFPKKKVRLSDTLVVETDGLDNLRKARLLRSSKIPLLAIKSSLDSLMGKDLQPEMRFKDNFADDLAAARYGKELGIKDDFVVEIAGEHGTSFRSSFEAKQKLKKFIKQSTGWA